MKNKEKQIKDKRRVTNFGEVLTKKREVKDMLNLVNSETTRLDSRFFWNQRVGMGIFSRKF